VEAPAISRRPHQGRRLHPGRQFGARRDARLGLRVGDESAAITEGWKPWGEPEKILEIWDKAIYVGEMCNSIYKPWHFPWSDRINIEVQKALTGQITADQCCDTLIAAIKEVQKS